MGVSRSASMVIAYFMKENLWKFEDAYNFVKKQRSIVYPNYGFQKQLKKYEIKLGLLTEEEFLTFLNQRPNIFMNQLLSK
jgi:protein-tyrosine phosphatase